MFEKRDRKRKKLNENNKRKIKFFVLIVLQCVCNLLTVIVNACTKGSACFYLRLEGSKRT